jgi:hypothetical protein
MSAEDGLFRSALKPQPRVRSLMRGAVDLVISPQAIDDGAPFEFEIGWRRASCLYDEYSCEPLLKLKHAGRAVLAAVFARRLSRHPAADRRGHAHRLDREGLRAGGEGVRRLARGCRSDRPG